MKILAYHGTPFTFKSFDPDYQGYATRGEGTDQGFFFAEEKDHAEYWCERNSMEMKDQGEKISPRIMRCELSISNLFEADMQDYRYIKDIISEGISKEADCIQINNAIDDESGERRTMYIIFDPKNIKIIKKERYLINF